MVATTKIAPATIQEADGKVYCFVCTHSVAAKVLKQGSRARSKPGQSCPRCGSTLDSAHVVFVPSSN